MNLHTTSFLISLAIHSIIFLFLAYYFVEDKEIKKVTENKLCIKIAQLQPNIIDQKKYQPIVQKHKVIKKLIKKKKIITRKKVIKKKIIRKKIDSIDKAKQIVNEKKQIDNIVAEKELIDKKEVKLSNNKKIINEIKSDNNTKKEKDFEKEKRLKDEQNEIAKKIRDILIKNKYYPKQAIRRGIEGIVFVEFKLQKDGYIKSLKVTSKYKILNSSLKKTIKNISREFPIPKSEILIQVPINFSLKR